MGRIVNLLVLSALLASGLLAGEVWAADIEPSDMIEDAPALVEIETASGWYLRGDIGYSLATDAEGDFSYRTFDGIGYGADAFDNVSLSDDFSFGLGFGYSFNDWLRADVTVDRFTADFDGMGPDGFEASSELTGYSAMLNGYVDLGTFVGFTPYLGAGVGSTYLSWDDLQDSLGLNHAGESDWRFTYALMGGVSYDVSARMKIDFGYRYRNVDGGDMFGWDSASDAAGATGTQGDDSGSSTHEIRVGLRYKFR